MESAYYVGYLGSFVKGNQVGIRLNPIDWQGALLLIRRKQEFPPSGEPCF